MKKKYLLELHWLDGGGFEEEVSSDNELQEKLENLKKDQAEYSCYIYRIQPVKHIVKLNKSKKITDSDKFDIDIYNEVMEDTQY